MTTTTRTARRAEPDAAEPLDLAAVLALRPATEADAATIRTAIAHAEAALTAAHLRTEELQRQLDGAAPLATSDDELEAIERDLRQAKRTAGRIEALLAGMRADLAKVEAAETLETLRAEAVVTAKAVADLNAWLAGPFEDIRRMLAQGFVLETAAVSAHRAFLARVEAAYRSAAVRAAGPLGEELPDLPGTLPRTVFPNWQ
jgi:hypothetical protein